MTDGVMSGQLQVKCRFTFQRILKCCIHAKYGRHTYAEIVGSVKAEETKAVLTDVKREGIILYGKNTDTADTLSKETLFSGIIKAVELKEEGGYAVLSLAAVSYTWKMDLQRKERSFQNPAMTYKDVVGEVIRDYGTDLIWNCSNKKIDYPFIQYKETDFQFIKRVLSYIKEGITTDDFLPKVCIHAGIRSGSNKGNISINQYNHTLIPFPDTCLKKVQIGYKIEDVEYSRVGDVFQIQGKNFYVMEAQTIFEQNVMKCDCTVYPAQCFMVEKKSAETLRNIVLTGRVLETRQEFIKLHLDIDREQSPSKAYEFLWKPLTGNMLYCMPEAGTIAALYVGNAEESNAAVIYNIRENSDKCNELMDYKNRYFTTGNKKQMYLKPSEMGIINGREKNTEIALRDKGVLNLKTGNQISVMAEGQVELKGKNITITTPIEATLVKKDIISPAVINMCNAFDAIGDTGNFAASPKTVKEKKKKTVPGLNQRQGKYMLDGAVETILSNIPIDDSKNPVMEMIAGSMPIISRVMQERQ